MTNPPDDDRGEYPIGPEPAPNPRPFGAPRVRINTSMMGYDAPAPRRPIPYARPMPVQESEPSTSLQTQFKLGLLSPLAAGAALLAIGVNLDYLGAPSAIMTLVTWAVVGAFIATVVYVSVHLRWKGFLAGVLTAVLIFPLIFLALCGPVLMGIAKDGFR